MKKYSTIITVVLSTLLMSCQKVIDLKLNNSAPQIVIEGDVNNLNGLQTVKISQTVPFSNSNNFPGLSGAIVKIADNEGNAHLLRENSAGTYTANFKGLSNQTYTLSVLVNGQSYTANSTMPNKVNLDSLTLNQAVFANNDSQTIVLHYQDPQYVINQYRYIMYVNGVEVNRIFAQNDDFSDGRLVQLSLFQNDISIKKGDNVKVEMQCIDKAVYTYFFALSSQQANGPNGSTTPSNPPSNISNNALGYFSAHTVQDKNIIIP